LPSGKYRYDAKPTCAIKASLHGLLGSVAAEPDRLTVGHSRSVPKNQCSILSLREVSAYFERIAASPAKVDNAEKIFLRANGEAEPGASCFIIGPNCLIRHRLGGWRWDNQVHRNQPKYTDTYPQ
jgi:hypothetical protein